MVSSLDRKLVRELFRLRGQVLTIALVVAAGVASYITLRSAWRAMHDARAVYYDEYRFADVFVHLKRAPTSIVDQIAELPGVATAYPRIVEGVLVPLDGPIAPPRGELLSLPSVGKPILNDVMITKGRMVEPGRYDEVLVYEPFAQAHGLDPGDRLPVVVNGKLRHLQVVGHALSPEYVFAIEPGLMVVDDERFSPLWMLRDSLAAAYQMEGAFNNMVLKLEPGANEKAVLNRIDQILEPYGGLGALGRKHQMSHSVLQGELQQIEAMVIVLPAVFLAVAAFLLNVVFSRLVSIQRPQIAVLKAIGYRNRTIAAHYLRMVALIVAAGSIVGIGLGIWLGNGMIGLYADFFRLPMMTERVDVVVSINAVLASFIAAALGASFAVRAAVELPPEEAMRPAAPVRYRTSVLERFGLLRWLTQAGLMIAREIWRRPARTVFSSLGIAFALGIVVLGRFGHDAFGPLMSLQFERQQREDLMITFQETIGDRSLGHLAHLPGVEQVEGLRLTAVRFRSQHRWRDAALYGISYEGELRRVFNLDFEPVDIPEGGVLLTNILAEILGVKPGETVEVELKEGDRSTRTLTVTGLIDEAFGIQGYLSKEALHEVLREAPTSSMALMRIDPALETEVQSRLKEIPAVQGVMRKRGMLEKFEEQTRETMRVVTLIMTLFATAIAIAVVYNNARVSLSMRSRDLATLRVLGFSRGEISAILLGEQAVQVILALPLGLILGTLGAQGMVALQADPEQFRMPFLISTRTYAFAMCVIMAAGALSALLVRRKLDQLDLIAVLKTRE